MKTPREILLAQHRAIMPKLDDARQAAVVMACDHQTDPENVHERQSRTVAMTIFQLCWRELILPSRRLWSGLAAVWLLIIVVNVSQRDPSPAVKVSSVPAMMSLREQQQWMNELFADRVLPSDADRPRNFTPKPRTQTAGATIV